MTIKEIITLAMQGYKPGDIKELIELAKEVPAPEPEPAQAPEPEPAAVTESNAPEEPKIDYAAEIEKLRAENEKIRGDLAKAQEMNRATPQPEIKTKSDQEQINDMFLSLSR